MMKESNMSQKIRKAVIPAAGFGTRFLPATKSMPKEMMPIIDKPAIHYAVEEAVKAGITDIVFITGRGKSAIEDYFDHSYELEHTLELKGKTELLAEIKAISDMANIIYIRQKEPLGLGHAVLRAKDIIGDEPFAVILPDVLIANGSDCLEGLVESYEKSGISTITTTEVPDEQVHLYGIVDPEGEGEEVKIKGVVEKPKIEDAPSHSSILGRYVFDPVIFKYLENIGFSERGEVELTDAMLEMSKKEGLIGKNYTGKVFDTGDKLGFLQATVHMALGHKTLGDEFRKFLKTVQK
jgi:UTP--glucose-1-phosphate uridylyltransferase